MSSISHPLALVVLASLLPALPAQDLRRASANDEARELKRSAHRLRIGIGQLKNARQPSSDPKAARNLTGADYLESMLIGEYARDHFDAAVRYVRSLPDGELKLMSFLQIAQALRNPF